MKQPLLSIAIPGKNDDYHGSFERFKLGFPKTVEMVSRPEYSDVELVLCDWGSETKITEAMGLTTHDRFRCVYVPDEICKRVGRGANYSITHSINTAARYSTGKYVIFWDSDCYIPDICFDKLIKFVRQLNEKDEDVFYWGSRYHIPMDIHKNMKHYSDVDTYVSNAGLGAFKHEPFDNANFLGGGIALLMKNTIWHDCSGWWEYLIHWGWQDIELHNRLKTKYTYAGDLNYHGIQFFHLDHHDQPGFGQRICNDQVNSKTFQANGPDWGLGAEKLLIY